MPATDIHARPPRPVATVRAVLIAGCLALVGCCALAPAALGASHTKGVAYRGYRLQVPAAWPVYRLAGHPGTCVRFNRHAVYLGSPGADQRCPAHAAGRTEAILVSPRGVTAAGSVGAAARRLESSNLPGALPAGGAGGQLTEPARHVLVTATWGRRPALIRRALAIRSLARAAQAWRAAPRVAAQSRHATPSVTSHAADATAGPQPGAVYPGLGFDACTTPSPAQMSAWGASSYRAIGVYIGGTNMACAQPNLSAAWVSQQTAAGWHLVPIYVGLQAPSNSCGCAAISSAAAATEGGAAARDAVAQAQAVGLGAGNPLYFDMEGYNPSATTSSAVLTFLASWTSQLHAMGYRSGVYSSADSGIRDLVTQAGTGYAEPDDIWVARWNGAQDTADPNVPSADWASHQRLHQYRGAHNETYAGATINIDSDYLDAATAVAGTVTTAASAGPSLSIVPGADGTVKLYPSWSGPGSVSSWQVLAGGAPNALSRTAGPVDAATRPLITQHSAYPYFQVQALDSAGQTVGVSPAVATPAHVSIFANDVFVPRRGPAAVPVGCFAISACRVTLTIATRTTLVRTRPLRIPSGGGLAYLSLSSAAHALVARARHHRLPVTITVRASTGARATRHSTLVPYTVSGRAPKRQIVPGSTVRIVSATAFVVNGWTGGVLAACLTATPCRATTTIVAGRTVIARSGSESLGVNETGYLRFRLTAAGHRLLADSPGNQLAARVDVVAAGRKSTAAVALSMYH